MLNDKIEKLFKSKDLNSKKKIENLTFFLIVLIITVIIINTIWKDDKNEKSYFESTNNKELASNTQNEDYDNLEHKLETILSNMVGVGDVNVLITYNETKELIPVYNKTDKKSITDETDSTGGNRKIEETDITEEVAFQNDEVIVKKMLSPQIEGAIIIATGATNSAVKNNIINAVEAATGLPTHKIQVFEKN